jgi:hypothetical protein
MVPTRLRHWLKTLTRSSRRKPAREWRKLGFCRPCLEPLEERLVPTSHTWTGAGGNPD